MGQKVHPIGFRLGIIKPWKSCWYADNRKYAEYLHEDVSIRGYLGKTLKQGAISEIIIERVAGKIRVNIHTARPGIVIGKKGAEVDRIRKALAKLTDKQIQINVVEIRKADMDARLIAEGIAMQLEKRVAFRKAMKKAVSQAMKAGAQGVKVYCGGRLAGAEMARREWYREGRVPLHTLRADIDYAQAEANTTYGKIGVKVWLFKGEILSPNEIFLGQEKK